MLFTVFICLIASGGAFAYFSHGSDSLLPSIAVPDATALLPPPPPLSLAEGVFQVRQMKTVKSMLRQQNLGQEDQPEAETEPSGVAVFSTVAVSSIVAP